MELIDLTVELAHGMVRHPAPHLPPVEIVPVATHEVQKRSVQKVTFGTHVSTHIDAPLHAIPGGQTIDCVPLDTLCGPAALVRIAKPGKDQPIDRVDLEPHQRLLTTAKRVIVETGWLQQTWGRREYFTEGTYLTRDAARYLAGFKIALFGMDFPNIDSNAETKPGIPAPNHNIMLGTGMVLLENLTNLWRIPGESFELIALPLRLVGGDGCPCRAVARLNGHGGRS
ncbi:MAG: cyclase family protein [Alphaproteobacteria bacterium]|nr:cyclase family protein [Alphaproteobacteria bacterium]